MRHCNTLTAAVLVPLATLAIGLSGCIERSVVIKVKDNGSGVVHLRSHQQATTIGFITIDKQDDEAATAELSPRQLDKLTAALGPGVRMTAVKKTTNRSGWQGQDVIWEFDDINELVLPNEVLEHEDGQKTARKPEQAKQPSGYRFSMANRELQIHPFGTKPTAVADAEPVGAVDPFADKPASPSLGDALAQQVMAKALADVRVGIYVQIDGEIESSNAKHREGNLITLLNIELGELLSNPNLRPQLEKLDKQEMSLPALGDLADQIDGISIDLQDPIRVKIR